MRALPWVFAVLGCAGPQAAAVEDGAAKQLTPTERKWAPISRYDPESPLTWHRRKLGATGLSLELLASAPVYEVRWVEGGGTVFQQQHLAGDSVVLLSMRAGPGEDLESFRREHKDWVLSPTVDATVCGRRAEMVSASRAPERIACVMTPEGGHPAYVGPLKKTAIVFVHRGMPVRVAWEIESERMDAVEQALSGFFDSVRCDGSR